MDPVRDSPTPYTPGQPSLEAPTPPGTTPPTEPAESQFGPTQNAGLATTSLVLGVIGLLTSVIFIGLFLGIAALVTGLIAVGQIDNPAHRLHGRGKAVTGAILGGVAALLGFMVPFLALMVGMMVPALGAARSTAYQMQNQTQVRGVHQAMVMYAQSNRTYFPGLDENGDPVDLTPAGRLLPLLEGNYFTGDYLVAPNDVGMTAWTHGELLPTEYSYALLEIGQPGGRRDEWMETLNTDAVVLSDRNTGSDTTSTISSIHTEPDSGWWRGTIAYNDNHVMFETTPTVPTKYADTPPNPHDHLFEADGADDAMMIHDTQ